LSDAKSFEADVCIIGAGPAGLTAALELASRGVSVLILESGGTDTDPSIQSLNNGSVVGDAYAGLRATRHRALGGAACIWNTVFDSWTGAKYVPLDPWDFRGWPFDARALEPFYRRAQIRCGLGPFSYEAAAWESPAARSWRFPETAILRSRVYQLGPRAPFTSDYVRELRANPNVRLCEHATATRLVPGRTGEVARVEARARGHGELITVAARCFVLAGGAIENARLLLQTEFLGGNEWIGRCFMEHPRDWSLRLVPTSREAAAFYDARTDKEGVTVCGRLALAAHAAASGMPNFSITLLPELPPANRITSYLQRMGWLRDRGGYGWSQAPKPFFDRFRLVINLEQRPRPENHVALGRDTDIHGNPRAELHWRWTNEEQAEWERLRARIIADIESAGLGRVEVPAGSRLDPNAHHHAGTTRMSDGPDRGVVDRDCRVHGVDNLYVAGASVFPTAGYANPTLTIVALAIRLADHLCAAAAGPSRSLARNPAAGDARSRE
jgi:choline dehydrogenase-like flavoprotein